MQAMRGERSTVSILDTIAMLVDLERAGLETEAVQAFLLGTRVEPTSLGPYLHFDRTHYMRNLIYRMDGFELLAICWEIGQAAPIHDHEDQRCWARVEQGTLRFTNFRLLADDLLRLEQVGPAVPGEVGHLDALAGIHSVANHPSVGQRAVSLAPVFAAIPRVHDLRSDSVEKAAAATEVRYRANVLRSLGGKVGADCGMPTCNGPCDESSESAE